MKIAHLLGSVLLVSSAACAAHRGASPGATPLFTGNGCGTTRLRNQFDGSWQEVRSATFTYCVPPDFLPKDDGLYWESRYTRLAWTQDARVMIGHSRSAVSVVSSGREIVGPGEPGTDASFPETIDGEAVHITVLKSDNDFYLEARFKSGKFGALYGKSSRETGIDVLRAVLRSIRFTR